MRKEERVGQGVGQEQGEESREMPGEMTGVGSSPDSCLLTPDSFFPRWASIALLFAINCIFVYKYASRTAVGFLPFLAGFVAVFCAGIIAVRKFHHRREVRTLLYRVIVPAWLLLLLAALIFIRQSGIKVDRYVMIDLFWNNLFSGLNPYLPREIDTNVPSPLPFYFILFLPFKLLGDIGPAVLIAASGLFIFLGRRTDTVGLKPLAFFLAVCSPALAFEVVTRSTVFINALLAVLFFSLLRSADSSRLKTVLVAGLCAGIIASTRAVAILWLIAGALYYARMNSWNIRSITIAVLIAAAVFIIPVAILYGAFPESFRLYNPFRVESEFMPAWFGPIALAAFVIAGLAIKRESSLYYFLGFASYGLIVPYLVEQLCRYGFHRCIFEHQIDVSYQIFCLPFFLAALVYSTPHRASNRS